MPLTTADLAYLLVEIRNFDGQTLPQEVSVAKLPQLAPAPSVYVALLTQRDCVAFSTLDIDDIYVFELRHRPDLVLVQYVAVTKLATIPPAPRENHALVVNGCCVVVAKSKFHDGVFLQVLQLSRNWLPSDVYVA